MEGEWERGLPRKDEQREPEEGREANARESRSVSATETETFYGNGD